jgi:uncharacterized membrane protein YjgN (DUF898 family)
LTNEGVTMDHKSGRFYFDGGAGSYLVTGVLAALTTIFTFGTGLPFALVLLERRRARHTYIDGQRLMFSGTGLGLFVLMIKLCCLCFVTLGIYSFWVPPRIQEWKVEHTDFDPTWQPRTLG